MKSYIDQIAAIASVTFQELLREKILWSTLVFALFILCLSFALAQLSIYEPARIALDFGAAAVGLTGSMLAIIIGGGLISREIKERTLYLVLTKSIDRWQFVLGKLLGLFGVLILNSFMMYLVLMLVFILAGGKLHVNYAYNIMLQLDEFFMLASIGIFFSTFSTSMLASIFTIGLWLIGHAMDDARIVVERMPERITREGVSILIKTFPDFTVFNLKSQLSHNIPVELTKILLANAYAFAFCVFVLTGACVIFSKRDL